MNGYIICSLSVLVLYPTLVVRSITRPTLHPQIRTHSFPNAMLNANGTMDLKAGPKGPLSSGHSAGLNFFLVTSPKRLGCA